MKINWIKNSKPVSSETRKYLHFISFISTNSLYPCNSTARLVQAARKCSETTLSFFNTLQIPPVLLEVPPHGTPDDPVYRPLSVWQHCLTTQIWLIFNNKANRASAKQSPHSAEVFAEAEGWHEGHWMLKTLQRLSETSHNLYKMMNKLNNPLGLMAQVQVLFLCRQSVGFYTNWVYALVETKSPIHLICKRKKWSQTALR